MQRVQSDQAFWDQFARFDPLWAILSDPSKSGRRWDLAGFLETGRREISLLMYQLRALGLTVPCRSALDFGCGVGRLTQPLAGYFDRVVGIDVSPEMIRLANDVNPCPERVSYLWNAREDLALLATGEFDLTYSNVVLQHVEPDRAVQYLRELLRVTRRGGAFVFQLPSHPRPLAEQPALSVAMPADAYRTAITIDTDLSQPVARASELIISLLVTNVSSQTWSQSESGPIRVGNHWLRASGGHMLVQDDGRARLPESVDRGQPCRVMLVVHTPADPGEYYLECDVVHEGISWFRDKGSSTARAKLTVAGSCTAEFTPIEDDGLAGDLTLSLPPMTAVEAPGPLPMHGVHRDVVTPLIEEQGGTIVHVEADERSGPEWVGYRYFVRR